MIGGEVDWAWGGTMTALGMGVVFALLGILWLLLSVIGRLDEASTRRAARAAEAQLTAEAPPQPSPAAVTVLGADGLDDETLAAIAVAVIKHADVRRKQAAPEMRTNAPGSQLWASRWVALGRGQSNTPWRRR